MLHGLLGLGAEEAGGPFPQNKLIPERERRVSRAGASRGSRVGAPMPCPGRHWPRHPAPPPARPGRMLGQGSRSLGSWSSEACPIGTLQHAPWRKVSRACDHESCIPTSYSRHHLPWLTHSPGGPAGGSPAPDADPSLPSPAGQLLGPGPGPSPVSWPTPSSD